MKKEWHRTNLRDLRDPEYGIEKSRKDVYRCFKKGWTKRKTASRLNLHERTVGRWYERFAKEGDPKYWGNARGAKAGSKIAGGKEDLIAHLRYILHSKSPLDFGLAQAKWDVSTIASYIKLRYGKQPSLRTVYRYLKRYLKACIQNSPDD